jgi:hypothetical protein
VRLLPSTSPVLIPVPAVAWGTWGCRGTDALATLTRAALAHATLPPTASPSVLPMLWTMPNMMLERSLTPCLWIPRYIQATCATNGEGLYEGLDYMSQQLKSAK